MLLPVVLMMVTLMGAWARDRSSIRISASYPAIASPFLLANSLVATSCPYAVSVGATLLTGNVSQDVETAVTRFPSGGGFSNVYPRPSWQNDAVNNYLTNHKPSYPSYNLGTVQTNNPTAAQTGNGKQAKYHRSLQSLTVLTRYLQRWWTWLP